MIWVVACLEKLLAETRATVATDAVRYRYRIVQCRETLPCIDESSMFRSLSVIVPDIFVNILLTSNEAYSCVLFFSLITIYWSVSKQPFQSRTIFIDNPRDPRSKCSRWCIASRNYLIFAIFQLRIVSRWYNLSHLLHNFFYRISNILMCSCRRLFLRVEEVYLFVFMQIYVSMHINVYRSRCLTDQTRELLIAPNNTKKTTSGCFMWWWNFLFSRSRSWRRCENVCRRRFLHRPTDRLMWVYQC